MYYVSNLLLINITRVEVTTHGDVLSTNLIQNLKNTGFQLISFNLILSIWMEANTSLSVIMYLNTSLIFQINLEFS